VQLQEELQYFGSIKGDLLEHHKGKFALIKGRELIDTFTTWEEAFNAGVERLGNVAFLIKQVQGEEENVQFPALVVGAISARS
jgi:hypothetical protein